MSAWSETLSPQARADVQAVVDAAIAAGRAALGSAGVIRPIPVLLSLNGQVVTLSIDQLVASETPLPAQASAALAALGKVAPAARAVALVTTSDGQGGQALEVWTEHSEGAALTLLQPYKRSLLGGVVEFDGLTAYPGQRRVWA